jgi:hypothetical protein
VYGAGNNAVLRGGSTRQLKQHTDMILGGGNFGDVITVRTGVVRVVGWAQYDGGCRVVKLGVTQEKVPPSVREELKSEGVRHRWPQPGPIPGPAPGRNVGPS